MPSALSVGDIRVALSQKIVGLKFECVLENFSPARTVKKSSSLAFKNEPIPARLLAIAHWANSDRAGDCRQSRYWLHDPVRYQMLHQKVLKRAANADCNPIVPQAACDR